MAIIPYTSYIRKAKAKELITFARACLQEAVSQCINDSNFSDFQSLSTCISPSSGTTYLENIQINPSGSCGDDINISVTGKIKGSDATFSVNCTYDYSQDQITCTQISSSS